MMNNNTVNAEDIIIDEQWWQIKNLIDIDQQ